MSKNNEVLNYNEITGGRRNFRKYENNSQKKEG